MKSEEFVEGLETEYPELDKLIIKANLALLFAGDLPFGKEIYYKRVDRYKSEVGIQVVNGDSEDLNNYIVIQRIAKQVADGFEHVVFTTKFGFRSFLKGTLMKRYVENDVIHFLTLMESRFTDELLKDFTVYKIKSLVVTSKTDKAAKTKVKMVKKRGSSK